MELLDLPNELLLAIIVLIRGFDILPCRLICKRVQELIDHSAESQLSIELASECLALAPWNDVPAATLLDRLRRSREAWRTLRPTREETIPIRDDDEITYDMYGHVFAKGKPGQIGPDGDPRATLEFWEMPVGGLMPVEFEGTRGWHHKYVDMGMDVADFAFDPSQDALCFMEKEGSNYIFHLRTLSSNLHHPDAKMIKMAIDGPLEHDQCDLQIKGRYVAALICSRMEGNVLTMWDWKSGECLLHELGIYTYTFLDAPTLLLVVPQDLRIVFKVSSPGQLSGANLKPKYLMFPDLSSSMWYRTPVIFHDSKLPQPESYPPTSMSFSRATIPAQVDHGVIVMSIGIFEINYDEPETYLVFFLREALIRLFQPEQECSLEEERERGDPRVDWADWGPKASRWFVAPRLEKEDCSVHGYRFVTLVTRLEASIYISPSFTQASIDTSPSFTQANIDIEDLSSESESDADADAPFHLLVLDFNPYPLRRHQYSPPPPTDGNGNGNNVIIAPSDVTFHDLEGRFQEDVIGRLACRATLMDEPADCVALVACEDNIIGFQMENDRSEFRVRTF